MREEITRDLEIRPSSVALWTGIMAGPFAWAVTHETKYALVHYACTHDAHWLFWVVTAAALLLTAFGAWQAWRGMRLLDEHPLTSTAGRAQFMAISGLLLSAAFALTIIALAIPDFFFRACD
jgi:hypothetical protein